MLKDIHPYIAVGVAVVRKKGYLEGNIGNVLIQLKIT